MPLNNKHLFSQVLYGKMTHSTTAGPFYSKRTIAILQKHTAPIEHRDVIALSQVHLFLKAAAAQLLV